MPVSAMSTHAALRVIPFDEIDSSDAADSYCVASRLIIRSQTSSAAGRCVTMITVRPRLRIRSSISRSVLGSSAEVHSSSRSAGELVLAPE